MLDAFDRELQKRACAKIITQHDEHLDEWLAQPRSVSAAEMAAYLDKIIDETAAEMQAEADCGEHNW